MVLNIDAISGGGASDFRRDLFTPSIGQTIFVLSATPADPDSVGFYVNSVKYELNVHFTLLVATITWNNVAFVMSNTDQIEINYVV